MRSFFKEKIITKKSILNETGAALITVAFLIPIIILITGAVTDIGGAMIAKENLYKACLISAEESTKAIDISRAQHEGINYLTDDFKDIITGYFHNNIEEKENFNITFLDYHVYESIENPEYIEVISGGIYSTNFLKLINIKDISVNAHAIGRLKRID